MKICFEFDEDKHAGLLADIKTIIRRQAKPNLFEDKQ